MVAGSMLLRAVQCRLILSHTPCYLKNFAQLQNLYLIPLPVHEASVIYNIVKTYTLKIVFISTFRPTQWLP
jgi:hypothetical protein